MTVMNQEVTETNEEDMTHFSLLRAAALPAPSSERGRRETKRGRVVVDTLEPLFFAYYALAG